MKDIRVKAARHIFEQCKKAKTVPASAKFRSDMVNLTDIKDDESYYGGFTFVPSIASTVCKYGRNTGCADAAHCEGKGLNSYETTFKVVVYDANYSIIPVLFAHFIGVESYDYWRTVFENCSEIEEFDVIRRTLIVDQEKSIDTAFDDVVKNVKLFLDPLHVKKNMGPKLGSLKASGVALYERDLHAPSKS